MSVSTTIVLAEDDTYYIHKGKNGAFVTSKSPDSFILTAMSAEDALKFAALVAEWARFVADEEYHAIPGAKADRTIRLAICPECQMLCRTDEDHWCTVQDSYATSEGATFPPTVYGPDTP